jgi:PAS domain S-box-containing protein
MQPLAKKLPLIVLLFVWIVGCILFLVTAQMDLMSGVRAYVAGQRSWSMARKDAVQYLRAYVHSRAERDYDAFLQAIAVPLGDHRARLELQKPVPDADVVRAGFVAGRNHPDDVSTMATTYRRFRHMRWMAEAMAAWAQGDELILTLQRLGEELHEGIRTGRATRKRVDAIVQEVSHLDDRLQPLEDAFAQQLGEGARELKNLLVLLTCLAAGLLLSAGAFLSLALLRHLRASEERYRGVFENANDLIYTHDLAGNITSINPAGEYITGYSREEACRLNIADILIPEHLECARQMIARKVADGGATVYELDVVAKDGRRIPLEVSTRLIVERGRAVGVQGIARDISERKRAEQALQVSRLQLEGKHACRGHSLGRGVS